MLLDEQLVVDNPLQAKVHGNNHSWGASMARIKPGRMTYLSACTAEGKLKFYMGEGNFTEDKLDEAYFGNAGVVQIEHLQKLLLGAGTSGFKHHVAATGASVERILREAFTKYLPYEVVDFEGR